MLTSTDNIFYATGFRTEARRPSQLGYTAVLTEKGKSSFFCPANWAQTVGRAVSGGMEVVPYRGGMDVLALTISSRITRTGSVGVELDGINAYLFEALKKLRPDIDWVNISQSMREERLVKTPDEVERIRRSARLACRAMERARELLLPGRTEWEVMAELEYYMRKNGSSGTPFTMKVLAGENAVKTIHLPGNRVIERGQIVLIDMGATVDGYASDWTRSFAVGEASREQRELYELVWRIERGVIEMIRPGVTYSQLMEKAFSEARGHKFEKYFNPFLGHSLGINSQEWPNIDPYNQLTLRENMTITIEPGVYVPGVGGVRIEDDILVTAAGHEILTGLEKEDFVLELD